MLTLNIIYFLYFSTLLVSIAGDFDFRFHFCEFKCKWGVCDAEDAPKDEKTKDQQKMKGYYWRDFHGTIPSDAFPIGNSTQSPKSYIGLVNAVKFKGTFITTIFEGLDYVYVVFKGQVEKFDDDIQILCTQEPEKLKWVYLNGQKVPNAKFLAAGHYQENAKTFFQYIVRVPSCKMNHAAFAPSRTATVEYTFMDGSTQNSSYYQFFYYDLGKSDVPENAPQEQKEADARKKKKIGLSYFQHQYEYAINPNSIIPTFYKRIKAGPCSMVCTNRDLQKKQDENKKENTDISMDYFWTPKDFFDKTYALKTGVQTDGNEVYTAQGSVSPSGVDVGYTIDGRSAQIAFERYTLSTSTESKILGIKPEKFSWVPSNSSDFKNVDLKKIIPGGRLANGTKSYVGRVTDGKVITTASVKLINETAYAIYTYFGPSFSSEFDVLIHV